MTAEQEAALRHARMTPQELREEEGVRDWAALYDHDIEVLADLCEQQALEIEALTKELAVQRALARELAICASQVSRGFNCWCEHGIGNPMMTEHAPACRELRALLARPDVRALREGTK